MTIPQVVGMYKNDRTRKEILVDFGFRLPSALDNRPLTFEEFEAHLNQAIYMCATPGAVRARAQPSRSSSSSSARPASSTRRSRSGRPRARSTTCSSEIRGARRARASGRWSRRSPRRWPRTWPTTCSELGVKVQYLHSEVDTLERVAILRDLRLGVYDVLVGINLLREGIDLPEVTLVAILDADKEGFLRSAWSLIQMIGRAARNIGGEVVMYADRVTESMQVAIDETDRRRAVQEAYNVEHGIEPPTIVKGIRDINDRLRAVAEATGRLHVRARGRRAVSTMPTGPRSRQLVAQMEAEMRAAAKELEFERAAALRDEIQQIRLRVLEQDASVDGRRAPPSAPPSGAPRPASRPDRRRRSSAAVDAAAEAAAAAARCSRSPA